jgi:hypothetical protein
MARRIAPVSEWKAGADCMIFSGIRHAFLDGWKIFACAEEKRLG